MPDQPKRPDSPDDVEKFLAEQKAVDDRRQAMIKQVLAQREAALKDFDDKLARLGYVAEGKTRKPRSHHTKAKPE